jgi:hypothetical protein
MANIISQAGEFTKADSLFTLIISFPDSIYGYYWRGRVNLFIRYYMMLNLMFNTCSELSKTLDIALTDKLRI